MRAVAVAASGKFGFRILPKSQRGRNGRKAEGGEQDQAKQTAHACVECNARAGLSGK